MNDAEEKTPNSLRYPIGEFVVPGSLASDDRLCAIREIADTPRHLRRAVADLAREQLDTAYRPGGWTVRQVVHHLPDSHINAYTRCKLALTESTPEIRTYDEAGWAELADSRGDIEVSLQLLDALHRRWVCLLERLEDRDWRRRLRHPEMGELRVDGLIALYSWHGRHHVGHITALRERQGW